MRPEADLSLLGQVRLVAEFLECLDLRDVTLVGNDWGGAQNFSSPRDATAGEHNLAVLALTRRSSVASPDQRSMGFP
jgi:hypothetical protein